MRTIDLNKTGFTKGSRMLFKKGVSPLFFFMLLFNGVFTLFILPVMDFLVRRIFLNGSDMLVSAKSIQAALAIPYNILTLVVFLFIFISLAVFQISVVTTAYYELSCGRNIQFGPLLKKGLVCTAKAFVPKNWTCLLYTLLFLPFTFFGLGSGTALILLAYTYLKAYMTSTVLKWALLYSIAGMLFLIFFAYAYFYYIVENKSFTRGLVLSLTRYKQNFSSALGHTLYAGLILLVWNLLGLFLALVLIFVVHTVLTATAAQSGFTASLQLYYFAMASGVVFVLFFVLRNCLSILWLSACLTESYCRTVEETQSILKKKRSWLLKKSWMTLFTVLLLIGTVWLRTSQMMTFFDDDNLKILLNGAIVTAHRGNSATKPENSMSAFKEAIVQGADYIELDVVQLADGTLMISHDTNTKTITGKDIPTNTATWDMVKNLDIGSYKSPSFKDERYPTLGQVLDLCKGKIKVNIEMKVTEKDKNFPQAVADLIREKGMENEVVAACNHYDTLKAFSVYAPEIKTVYIIEGGAQDLESLPVSGFSYSSKHLTIEDVQRAHLQSKMVNLWAIYKEDELLYGLHMNVDNLITNNVAQAKTVLRYHQPGEMDMLINVLKRLLILS